MNLFFVGISILKLIGLLMFTNRGNKNLNINDNKQEYIRYHGGKKWIWTKKLCNYCSIDLAKCNCRCFLCDLTKGLHQHTLCDVHNKPDAMCLCAYCGDCGQYMTKRVGLWLDCDCDKRKDNSDDDYY